MDRQSKRLARVVKQLAGGKKSKSQPGPKRPNKGKSSAGFSRPVQAPVSSTSVYTAPPRAAAQIISHREYVNDVVSANSTTGAFASDIYNINPGNASLFPWLSQIAQAYEEYEILAMKFIFRKLAPSTTQGLVMMGVQYDSYDAAFTSKAEMQDYAGVKSTAVWNDLEFDIDVKAVRDRQKVLYVLPPGVSPSGDSREYYAGVFTIATSNCATQQLDVGELMVQYSVRFTKPLLSSISGAGPLAEKESTASGFTPLSGSNLFQGVGVTNIDTGTPFNLSQGSVLQSSGIAAASAKAAKWLLSTGYFGNLTSPITPTAVSTLIGPVAGTVVTDVSGGSSTDPVFQTATNFGDVRHWTLDFGGVSDQVMSKVSNLLTIAGPTWTGGSVTAGTGLSAAVLTKISKTMYNNLVNPVPGSKRLPSCPVLRHAFRLPANFRAESHARQLKFIAPERPISMRIDRSLLEAKYPEPAPALVEGTEQDFELIETGIARRALRTDFDFKSSIPRSSSTKGTPVQR